MPARKDADSPRIYQLKVTLKHVKPPIWRRFQVRADISLDSLHGLLQDIMGWSNGHLHVFEVGQMQFGDCALLEDGDVHSSRTTRLEDALPNVGDKLNYLYDFGDGWEHVVLVEKALDPEFGTEYPVCLQGKRNCPPEDCGGPWGYQVLLETLADPSHEEHETMMEWIGGAFDSELFDCETVNLLLKRRAPVKRSKTR